MYHLSHHSHWFDHPLTNDCLYLKHLRTHFIFDNGNDLVVILFIWLIGVRLVNFCRHLLDWFGVERCCWFVRYCCWWLSVPLQTGSLLLYFLSMESFNLLWQFPQNYSQLIELLPLLGISNSKLLTIGNHSVGWSESFRLWCSVIELSSPILSLRRDVASLSPSAVLVGIEVWSIILSVAVGIGWLVVA